MLKYWVPCAFSGEGCLQWESLPVLFFPLWMTIGHSMRSVFPGLEKSLWCWKSNGLCHLNPRPRRHNDLFIIQFIRLKNVCVFKRMCLWRTPFQDYLSRSLYLWSAELEHLGFKWLNKVFLWCLILSWSLKGNIRTSCILQLKNLEEEKLLSTHNSVFSNVFHSPVSSIFHGSLNTHSLGCLLNCHMSFKGKEMQDEEINLFQLKLNKLSL